MNVVINQNSSSEFPELDELEPEIAAPVSKKNGSFSSPLDQIKRGFYHIVFNSFSAFRLAMVGSLLNEKALTELETTSVADATGFDIAALAQSVTMQKLREWMRFKPGNGKTPFEVAFIEDMYNIDSEVVDKIIAYLPKNSQKGMPLIDFIKEIESLGVQSAVSPALETITTKLKEQFVDTLDDLVEFVIRIEKKIFNEANNTSSLIYHFSIRTDASIYKEVVDSDRFDPYLLYLWVYNMMTANEKAGRKVISPRITVAHNQAMQKFATVAPKVNERGFALDGSGLPIFIPPNVNVVDKFLEAANSAVDDEGVFQPKILAEENGFANRLVYVDWVNDILAYTTNTGKLESYNLGQVHPMDKASEYMVLNTELKSPALRRVIQTLSSSVRNLDASEAAKFTSNEEAKRILQTTDADRIFIKVMQSGLDNTEAVKIKHLAGYDLDDYEETPAMAYNILALQALLKMLYEMAKTDQNAIEVPSNYKSLGLIFRLIGVEYVLQVGARMDAAYVKETFDMYIEEREKAKVDLRKKTFDIPNLHVGEGGIHGFLPHQGRILSCTEKTPSTFALPVQTGGGKTVISAVTAIKAIENIKSFPMITTKGNLVKGTITELNAITQGKINAIPLRPNILRRMRRYTSVKTFADFLKWYRSLPPNTILVNSYTDFASKRRLYEDLDAVAGFADAPVYTTQYLLMIKLLGIKVFIGDESHMIKNPDSARSRNSYAAFSQGAVRGEMSGTMVSNTVVDLVGQTRALSPIIFGDDPEAFAEHYGVSTGLIKSDEDARKIKDRLRSTTAYHEAGREDWAYMLPIKDDSFVYAELTQKQQLFYNILMQEAYLMLVEDEKRKGKKAKLESESEEDDDDEDEEEEDDDDDEDAALIAKAKTHLQKVEAFLVAPDENEQYLKWDQRPDGEDLISPKVRTADQLISEHLAKHKGNLKQNKIIIFGWNVAASKHFMKHSRYAAKTLHYTAGDEEVIRRFENDDTVIIMAADEGSVREGFNLQMTSLIIRMQSVWSPGDHEQTVARMYRPDPRGKYNRENVTHKWVLCKQQGTDSPTLDMVKMARLVSKSVSNARLTYEGKPEWRQVSREFDDMKLFKMNLQTIFDANPAEVQEYLGHWDTFTEWENNINKAAKYRLAQQLEAQFNVDLMRDGKIIDINEFIKLAMSEVKSTYNIPDSKRVWVPWIPNALPPDPKKWGFSVLGQRNIPVGTVVYTMFGPGIVTNILGKSVKVKIYDGRIIGMQKSTVMLVADNKYKELQDIVKNPAKWQAESIDIGGVRGVKPAKEKLPDKEEVIETLDEEVIEDDNEKVEVEVIASIINGWPALMVLDDVPQLKGISDWKRIDPFLSIHFRTWQALDSFIDLLDSKTYIPQDVLDALDDEIEELKTGKAMVLGKQINPKTVRQFFLDQHKKLGKKGDRIVCKPYFIAVEREVKLAFDIDSHEPRLISWLMRSKEKIPGIKSIRKNGAIWINTFTTPKEAYEDLDSLNDIANIDKQALREDLVAIRDEIRDLRKPRSKPSV